MKSIQRKRKKVHILRKKRGNFVLHEKFAGNQKVHDTTYQEVNHHADALTKAGFDVEIVDWNPETILNLREKQPDIIFNTSSLVETAILDEMGLPYVGTNLIGCVIATDKALAKNLWIKNKLPTSPFVVANTIKDCLPFKENPPFPYPLFIKPSRGRGSAGIDQHSLIRNYEELINQVKRRLKTISQPVLIEQYLQGREITCGIVGNRKSARALPLLEISYKQGDSFLTFDKKELDDDKFMCPAKLSEDETMRLQNLAINAFKVAGLRDYGRVDMILTSKGPFLLEVNSFAGLMCTPKEKPHSYMGFMARAEGKSPSQFIEEIVMEGWNRIYSPE
jgi:D-alanine-D-alanine ligase